MGDKIESQKNIKHTFYFGGSIMGYTDPPLFLQRHRLKSQKCKIYTQHKIGFTKNWETINNKTRNNNHNIYERKHPRKLPFIAFISTSHWQPFKITCQE